MSELRPVRSGSTGLDGTTTLLVAFLLGGLVVAIVKPWGGGGSSPPLPFASPPATVPPAAASTTGAAGFNGLEYDPSIFGAHEPAAAWAIWPAGYLVTFGFVIQLSGEPGQPGSPAPSNPEATPSATRPSAPPPASGPTWPARFDLPEGNHLFLIGVDMPAGFALSSHELLRLESDGTFTTIPIAELPPPWPSHFAVLGIRDPAQDSDSRLIVWPSGDYRLQLTFEPGRLTRSIEIRIASGPTPSPTP